MARPERHYESATEEFERRVRELYALADKIGWRLTIIVKTKSSNTGVTVKADPPQKREPGEN